MKKLFLSILSVAVIAGSVFAFAGCGGKDYSSEIKDLQAQIEELEDKTAKISELEAELAQLKNDNSSPSDNSALQTEISSLKSVINALQTEINNLKNSSNNGALQTEINSLKSDNSALQNEINSLKSDISALQTEINNLKNSSDNSALQNEINSLKSDISALQTEINNLKNSADLFTGSPKFNYSINETIPYYINGTKIFDFKVTVFEYYASANAVNMDIEVTFIPSFNESPKSVFTAKLFDSADNTIVTAYVIEDNGMAFRATSGAQKTLILYYLNSPFASITATPTNHDSK